jgi:ABC-type multidrug transport system fused ATPase/permease subunit
LINSADVVYVIEDGRVTMTGAPSDLVQRGGWFARFMTSTEEMESPAA